jgi:hypothetical protein
MTKRQQERLTLAHYAILALTVAIVALSIFCYAWNLVR